MKSRRMTWVGHVGHMGDRICEYRVLVGRPEGKKPLEKRRHKWEDNIKIYHQIYRIRLAQEWDKR